MNAKVLIIDDEETQLLEYGQLVPQSTSQSSIVEVSDEESDYENGNLENFTEMHEKAEEKIVSIRNKVKK